MVETPRSNLVAGMKWLRLDRLLGEHGMGRDTATGRRQWEAQMEAHRGAEEGRAYREIH